jgi:hypothetical protein
MHYYIRIELEFPRGKSVYRVLFSHPRHKDMDIFIKDFDQEAHAAAYVSFLNGGGPSQDGYFKDTEAMLYWANNN